MDVVNLTHQSLSLNGTKCVGYRKLWCCTRTAVFEMSAELRYVSSYISPLIYTNSVSRFLPHVRFSDLLIFSSSRTGVLPLDAVQFGKMRLPSVRPSVRPFS